MVDERRGSRAGRAGVVGALIAALVLAAFDVPRTAASSPPSSRFVPLAPVRLADTRRADCGCATIDPATIRVDVTSDPAVPDDAIAAALTITSTSTTAAGFVTAYPAGSGRPPTSTLNTRPDRDVANSAIIPLQGGAIDVYTSAPGHVIVDVTGVFVPAATAGAGRFVPVPPQRLLDTRAAGGAQAASPGTIVDVPVPPGLEGAAAMAVNVTHVGTGTAGFVSVGGPGTSFLNYPAADEAVAATVIAPVVDGHLRLYDDAGGFVIVDLFGWFTGAAAPASADGLFVPVPPLRMFDTRAVDGRVWSGGTLEAPSPFAGAAALAVNVTVTMADRAGYVTVHPAGVTRPETSSLNPTRFDHTLANLALAPVSTRGLAVYASIGTDVVIDATGYFTGTAPAAPEPTAANDYHPPRVLIVGDSGLRGIEVHAESQRALSSFDVTVEAAGCRRLHVVSCTSPGESRAPATAVEAIDAAAGRFDIVVVTAGHNDSYDFELGFERVVDAARRKGVHTIVWQNYSTLSRYAWLDQNSALLVDLAGRRGFDDVVVADWRTYTAGSGTAWLWDGIHMTAAGAWIQTDYLARWLAALEHRPCPAPRTPGGPVADPCPIPDTTGPPADPVALYL